MINYQIIKRKTLDGWQVEWNGDVVFRSSADDAEFTSGAFANGLEMGITGSRTPLFANSKIVIRGWMDYLEGLDWHG